jgi:hypothetical protein
MNQGVEFSGLVSNHSGSIPPFLPLANHSSSLMSDVIRESEQRKAEEERYWLDNPLRVRESSASVSQRVRQYTLANIGSLVIRFAIIGRGEEESVHAFWWWKGKSGIIELPGARKLSEKLEYDQSLFLSYSGDRRKVTKIPSLETAEDLWQQFLNPCFQDIDIDVKERVERVSVALDANLYHVPLNFAWVPYGNKWFQSGDQPLGLVCRLCFTLNLTAHLIDSREGFNYCTRDDQDDLWVLEYDEENDESMNFRGYMKKSIDGISQRWGSRGRSIESTGISEIREYFAERREFTMLACHGNTDSTIGSFLKFKDCILISHNLAHSVAMKGNKLLILGACESAIPNADSYAQFVGSFIAAGAGAVLANPCRALIPTVCDIAAYILNKIVESGSQPVDLSLCLQMSAQEQPLRYRESHNVAGISEEDLMLWSASYQLWL